MIEPSRQGIRSRRVVTPEGVRPGVVVWEGETIEAVLAWDAEVDGIDLEDVGNLAVLPGGIDPHVHVDEPGRTEWEGFETATRAAAAGGVTTIADMPLNSSPVTVTVAALAEKRAAAEGRVHVDVGFHGGVVPAHVDDLDALAEAGVLGFKAFLVDSGLPDFPPVGEDDLRRAFGASARHGLPVLCHAELADDESPSMPDGGDFGKWVASRPSRWETRAVELLLRLLREEGGFLHVVHLAAEEPLLALRGARDAGLDVTVETCPHYLTFAAETVPARDPRFKCAPPIRSRRHREALWRALADGDVDMVASDHSPAPPELRCLEDGDLAGAWGGIASLQVARLATWSEALLRDFGLGDLARWTSSAPARLLGLEGKKGALAPGLDADVVVVDPEAAVVVDGASLEHRHPETPWDGRPLSGSVVRTVLRGRTVFDRRAEEPFAPPSGRLLARSCSRSER